MRLPRIRLPRQRRHQLIAGAVLLLLMLGSVLTYLFLQGDSEESAPVALPPAITLLPPFRSYQTVAEASALLREKGLEPEREHFEVPMSGGRTRVLDTVTSYRFRHLDVSGTLTLQFLNDHLYECSFRPDDLDGYARAVRQQLGLPRSPGKNGRSEVTRGHLRIASNVYNANSPVGRKLGTEPYILWQDTRLLAERRQP